MAELVRGKTGRVFGDLVAMLTVLKGLPLAYNKDMQEDKEAVFDAVDTLKKCLRVFIPMMETAKFRKDVMYAAAQKGFLNATDLADYLVRQGLPFRSAYKMVGSLVARCIAEGKTLETLTLDEYREVSPLFEADLYDEISLETCVAKRISAGGTGPDSVAAQIASVKRFLESGL
jgi:argininosuccinate lyase